MTDEKSTTEELPPRSGLRVNAQAFLDIIEPGERRAWVMLLALAFTAAIAEMLSAALVFGIAGMFTTGVDPSTLPVVGGVMEQLGGGDRNREVLIVAAFTAVFYALRGALVLGEVYYHAKLTQEAGRRLAVRLFQGYLAMPYPFFLQRNTADLIRTVYMSVRLVVVNFLSPLFRLISDSLVSTGILIILLVVAPWATLLACVILTPSVYAILRLVRPKIHRLGQQTEVETAAALRTLQHGLHGAREIKVTQTNELFTAVYDRSHALLSAAQYRLAALIQVPRVAVETLVFLFIVLLLVATTLGPWVGTNSLAILGLFAYAALRMMPLLNRTTANINKIRFGSAAVENVRQDLDAIRSSDSDSTTQISPIVLVSSIELRDVGFTYENSAGPALRHVDLVVERGETVGIVGQTGSGKSTVLDLILGLLSPTSGSVLVDGHPVDDNPSGWLSSIGMVPQSVFLIDDTIRRNIAFGVSDRGIADERIETALDLAQLGEFVNTLPDGLDTVVGEHGIRLSGGQRQRIAIARALYGDPQILILDEGTSALDTTTEAELMKALQRASLDRTLIIVAHRLSTVRHADRIVYLDDGNIADVGRYEELVTRNASFRAFTE